jgi:GntR family transcriptional regulator
MKDFSVSRDTIRKAMRQLLSKGLVYQVQGSGTYVTDPDVISKTLRLTSFSEDMRNRGLDPSSTVLNAQRIPSGERVSKELGLTAGTPINYIQRLRLAGGKPMAIESVYLHTDVEDSELLDPHGSLYDQLSALGYQVERAVQTISAVNLDKDAAYLLNQAVGAAAIRVSRIGYSSRGQAIESSETIYRGDRYSFELVVAREP